MDEVTTKGFLQAFPTARQLDARALRELLSSLRELRAPEGRVLFQAGDPAGPAFLILGGKVRVERRMASGRTVLLGRLSEGTIIGDMSLIEGAARAASAVVDEELLALSLERSVYEQLKDEAHPAALWLLSEIDRDVSGRIRGMYDRITRLRDEPELAAEPPAPEPVEPHWTERVRRWVERVLP